MKCWLSLPTLRLIWAKRLCYRRMKIYATLWSKYKHLCNKVHSMTRCDYKSYVDTITGHLGCSKKPFWSWVNKLKACHSLIPLLVFNNVIITLDSAKADLFNNYFASPLAELFSKSLSDEVLPLDWVSANVTPVFNKGDKQLPSNYHPISLTCIISNDVISNSQYGFRINCYTTTLLLTTIHDWAEALNNPLSTHCVLIDFAKAFDSVPHGRLLLKLQALGVHGSLLQWFRFFLTTLRQRVVVNGLVRCFI